MKKTNIIIPLAAASFLLSGCASTKLAGDTVSPVAIIDVEGNAVIWTEADEYDYEAQEDEGGGVLATAVNKLIDGNNPELLTAEDRMNYAEESLRHALEDKGITVLDKKLIVENKTYKYDTLNLLGVINTNTTADGYRKGLTSLPAKKARIFLSETGAKSILSAQFYFTKKIEHKTVRPLVSMKIIIQDEKGKKILDKDFTAESAKTVQAYGVYNKYEKTELVPLLNPLIDDVINRFIVEYIDFEDDSELEAKTQAESKNTASVSTKLGKPKSLENGQNAEALAAEKAAEDKAFETAKNLLDMGMEPEKISEATGLSIEKVNGLKNE